MKTTFKFAGLSALLFGQSLCLLAQTAWHNPAADSLLPIQGRAWNAETGKAYQRLPQRAEQLVRKPVWDLSLQTAGLYVKFYTNAPQIQVKYQVTGGFSMPHMPATGVSGVDLYTMDCNGQQYWCAANYQFGDTVRYTYNDLTYRNTHDKGNEFTLYLQRCEVFTDWCAQRQPLRFRASVGRKACRDIRNFHCARGMCFASRYGLDQYPAAQAGYAGR